MARFMTWIKEHPIPAALVGFGLGWAIKVSLKEYIPEHMEPRSFGPETRAQAMRAKSLRRDVLRRRFSRRVRPGELDEFGTP
jgi:hypothetical protein